MRGSAPKIAFCLLVTSDAAHERLIKSSLGENRMLELTVINRFRQFTVQNDLFHKMDLW
jgi:hypothetical protein